MESLNSHSSSTVLNYLAHLLLSGNDADLMVGNYIADGVKGRQVEQFSPRVRDGITVHREIDRYTDAHPVVEAMRERLRPHFRKYAGVVVDVYFDHFLALRWPDYGTGTLPEFARQAYRLLQTRQHEFPERGVMFLHYMVRNNILVGYSTIEGIDQVFRGMAHRASFESGMEAGAAVLQEDYAAVEQDFHDFFPALSQHIGTFIETLNHRGE